MDILSAQTASTDYLSLLSVQLQNQDPIDPVGQEDLINDLTQFSILEGIQSLNASFQEILNLQELTQGIDLVGKEIQYIDEATGQIETGKAERLLKAGSQIRIAINQNNIGLDSVIAISDNSNNN
jgi:flagellar basal-body rod modification protein FlgD